MINRLMSIKQIADTAGSRVEMWARIIQAQKAATIAEVGVYKGEFAQAVLAACDCIEHYTMIDPWRHLKDWHKPANGPDEHLAGIFEQAMQNTAFAKDKITVLRDETKNAAPEIPDHSLDLAYIDGDHTLRGITIDLNSMWDKIKPGGLIGGDDFTKSVWQHGALYDPTFVCPYAIYFSEAKNVPIVALPRAQFLILKDSSMGFELIDFAGGYENLRLRDMVQQPV